MNETFFEKAMLEDTEINSKEKAVSSRLSRARSVERKLGVDLEHIVYDDRLTEKLLEDINKTFINKPSNYSNAVRKYYLYRRGKEFSTSKF